MEDISGFGLKVRLVASDTFPAGITLTQFADDGDPFDISSLQLRDKAMGLNGDLVYWSKANPLSITLNMIPAGSDDRNMEILVEANRVGRNKFSARDMITLTGVYPDGRTVTLSNGILTDGTVAKSVGQSARIKSTAYVFAFEALARTGAQ